MLLLLILIPIIAACAIFTGSKAKITAQIAGALNLAFGLTAPPALFAQVDCPEPKEEQKLSVFLQKYSDCLRQAWSDEGMAKRATERIEKTKNMQAASPSSPTPGRRANTPGCSSSAPITNRGMSPIGTPA